MGYDGYRDHTALEGLVGKLAAQHVWQGTPTLRDQMEQRLAQAQQEVKRVEELLVLLDRNPDFQRMMELLRP